MTAAGRAASWVRASVRAWAPVWVLAAGLGPWATWAGAAAAAAAAANATAQPTSQPAGQPVNVAGRINACRQRHQQAPSLPVESADGLALALWLSLRSCGQPQAPPDDTRLTPLRAQGAALWQQLLGQLNLACSHCHDPRAGLRLGGAPIPQGHATGYPLGRLEWQALGNLQRRWHAGGDAGRAALRPARHSASATRPSRTRRVIAGSVESAMAARDSLD